MTDRLEPTGADPVSALLAKLPALDLAPERAARVRTQAHALLARRQALLSLGQALLPLRLRTGLPIGRHRLRRAAQTAGRVYTRVLEPAWALGVVILTLAWSFERVAFLLAG